MFTIKADIIRLSIGIALFTLTSHWVFTSVGAILIVLACLNLFIAFRFPHLVPKESDVFPSQTFAQLVQEGQASAPPTDSIH